MISNKYINAIIATIITIAILFTTIFYTNSKNINSETTKDSNKFTYVDTIFNKEKVLEIDIEVSEDNWNYLLENAANEEYINANITVNGTKYYNVGIRAKGNSSLSNVASDNTTDRYSFKVKFDEYVDGQTLDGLSKISLNNIISDATYMKEYLSYDLLDKMGVPTPAFAFTNITLNGEEWGFYFAIEVIEEEFIERNYGSLSGNLYKPEGNDMGGMKDNNKNMKPNMGDISNLDNTTPPDMSNLPDGDITSPPDMNNLPDGDIASPPDMNNLPDGFREGMMGKGMGASNGGSLVYTDDNKDSYSDIFNNEVFKTTSDSDEERVIEMIKNLNEGVNLEEYLNIDEILRYFAVNTFLVNLDSYASNMKHNYYLYERDGVFEILPWDYNLSFGAFNIDTASKAINFPIDSPVTDSIENSPLIGKLLEVDEYRKTYHEYLQEIVDYVNDGTYKNTINSVNSLISEYVKTDATAFYTYEEYESSITELINFGIDRAKSISAQLDGTQPSTSYGTIETTVNLTALGGQGMGNKDKNMDIQKPTGTNNIDSTTSDSSQDDTINENKTKNPNNTNPEQNMQPPMQVPNNEQPNINNNQEKPFNINVPSANEVNTEGKIFEFLGYLGFLLLGIIFVLLFKRRKFNSIK